MQAELVYYGKFTELSYLDSLPWDQFVYFHTWLRDTKKDESDAQKKAQQEQQQAASAARSRSSRSAPRRR
jgi:hypothetical protein